MQNVRETIDQLLQEGIQSRIFSGAQVAWITPHDAPQLHSVGWTAYEDSTPHGHTRREVHNETLFDTASLTKALVTAPLVWVALERGWMCLEDRLGDWLPAWRGAETSVTIRHVLHHTSGLPAWVPLYTHCLDLEPKARSAALKEHALRVLPEVEPGTRALYSDVGYMLLGFALERCFRAPLHEAASTWVFEPLGMRSAQFARPQEGVSLSTDHVAATESTQVDAVQGPALVGRVHDENASTLGGVAGHAGLFAHASDVLKFAQALLAMDGGFPDQPLFCKRSTMRALCTPRAASGLWEDRDHTDVVGSFLGGLDTPSGSASTAGEHVTRIPQGSTLGHLGFTGTSFWVDRARGFACVLLTNRVHPTRDNGPAMRAFRVRFHTQVFAAFDRVDSSKAKRFIAPFSPVLHACDLGWVMRRPTQQRERHVAIEVAKHAGALARMRALSPRSLQIEHKGTVDLVTEVDRACQEIIVSALESAFPTHRVLAEEDPQASALLDISTPLWVIDPIDGTTNLSHRLPHFAISIALVVRGVIVLGVVYDPMRDELFCAQRGRGAFLNGAPIRVSHAPTLAQALAATGFPYDRHTSHDNNMRQASAMLRHVQGLRRAGAAALDLAWVACGRLDLYWEKKLAPWDVAAGLLLVEEAGGVLASWDCMSVNLLRPEVIAAGSARLVSDVAHVLNVSQSTHGA